MALSFSGFGSIYLSIVFVSRRQLLKDSRRVAQESTQVVKSLQEGLGGIRDVLIDGTQSAYCEIYRKADFKVRLASGMNRFIGTSPRFVIEAAGMVLIATLAFFVSQRATGISGAIPLIGALALGAQRLLPVAQQAFLAVANITGAHASFEDVLELLDQELPDYANEDRPEHIPFNNNIVLIFEIIIF